MKPTVDIETTIVSYLTAWPSRDVVRLTHESLTRQWWRFHRPSFELFTSNFVIEEASRGDPIAAAERLKELAGIPMLPADPRVEDLAGEIVQAIALPVRAHVDAAHVAVAAVHGIRFLLTWNCTHLANGMLTDKIEDTCERSGFRAPRILTPELLMELP